MVVVGNDAGDFDGAIDWGAARQVVNPEPDEGLSSSLKVGIGALRADADAALIVLGDQPRLPPRAIRALLDAEASSDRPIVVPVYGDGAGRNPVLVRRAAFGLVDETSGDRGLGPFLESHPELIQEIPIRVEGGNPDVDTRADLVGLLENAWAARVIANAEQVERFREVPDGADFYAPGHAVSSEPTHGAPMNLSSTSFGDSSDRARRGSTSAPVPAATRCRSPWRSPRVADA